MIERRTYRIQSVSELTGVPAATLRAWERRYGIPKPLRTESRYRLYSETNLRQVRRMKELCASGMAPSEAAELIRDEPEATEPEVEVVQNPYDAAAERLVEAALSLDSRRIEGEVRFALTLGNAIQVVERIFCVAMHRVGEHWEQGVISVAHEHMASEIVVLAARDLLRLVPPAPQGPLVLLACFAEEQHVLPLYAAAFRFMELGMQVELLGPRTPPLALKTAVAELQPAMVGLSVTVRPPPAQLESWLDGYMDAAGGKPWIVGGAAAGELREAVEKRGGWVSASGAELAEKISSVRLKARGCRTTRELA